MNKCISQCAAQVTLRLFKSIDGDNDGFITKAAFKKVCDLSVAVHLSHTTRLGPLDYCCYLPAPLSLLLSSLLPVSYCVFTVAPVAAPVCLLLHLYPLPLF